MAGRHLTALLLAGLPAAPAWSVGEEENRFRISLRYETESEAGTSRSSSRGSNDYVEQVVAIRPDGVERVYDLPPETDTAQRSVAWQFPVRVLDGSDGGRIILNRAEMEERRDMWLAAAGLSPAECGRWYFTWNAFQVECEAEAVLDSLAALDPEQGLSADGNTMRHADARAPATVDAVDAVDDDARAARSVMDIDPDAIARQRARTDVVVGEVTGEPVTFEDAYARHRREQVSGSITVLLERDGANRIHRRTTTTRSRTIRVDGDEETSRSTTTLERIPIADPATGSP